MMPNIQLLTAASTSSGDPPPGRAIARPAAARARWRDCDQVVRVLHTARQRASETAQPRQHGRKSVSQQRNAVAHRILTRSYAVTTFTRGIIFHHLLQIYRWAGHWHRRYGVHMKLRLRLVSWLSALLAATLAARAQLGGARALPGARMRRLPSCRTPCYATSMRPCCVRRSRRARARDAVTACVVIRTRLNAIRAARPSCDRSSWRCRPMRRRCSRRWRMASRYRATRRCSRWVRTHRHVVGAARHEHATRAAATALGRSGRQLRFRSPFCGVRAGAGDPAVTWQWPRRMPEPVAIRVGLVDSGVDPGSSGIRDAAAACCPAVVDLPPKPSTHGTAVASLFVGRSAAVQWQCARCEAVRGGYLLRRGPRRSGQRDRAGAGRAGSLAGACHQYQCGRTGQCHARRGRAQGARAIHRDRCGVRQ